MTTAIRRAAGSSYFRNPWPALWAMMVGFFMIMLDSTVVAIANPTIMAQLRIGYATVVWVTSAYLLAYAVPMLVAGRLGDRFGPKNALGAWGTVASVASLVGPLAGGALVDSMGWEWIFFVNVPVGVIGLILAAYLIPALPHHPHRFDWFGVGLSGAGMFLIVFGLQQGQSANWQPWIWAVIVGGIGFMSLFVYWQARNAREPLIPLEVFNDRNFSLSNLRIAIIAFAGTGMMLPVTFYAQAVCGLSPTHTAVLFAPTAIVGGVLAPFVGMIIDRSHPLCVLGFGFSVLAIAMTWLLCEMAPGTPIWRLVLPFIALGVAGAFVWSPLTVTATRNLRPHLAGASSGVFNAVRQLGAVLGSASMAAFMTSRIAAEMPGGVDALTGPAGQDATVLQLPEFVREPFAAAMSQSMLLPAFVALFGIVAALFLVDFTGAAVAKEPLPESDGDADDDDYVEYILRREPEEDCDTQPLRASRPAAAAASRSGAGGPLAVSWSTSAQGMPPGPPGRRAWQADTESTAPSAL